MDRPWGALLKLFRDKQDLTMTKLVTDVTRFYDNISDDERAALVRIGSEAHLRLDNGLLSKLENNKSPFPKERSRILAYVYYFGKRGFINVEEADIWLNTANQKPLANPECQVIFGYSREEYEIKRRERESQNEAVSKLESNTLQLPVPISPPLAFAPKALGEILIVIVRFHVTSGNRDTRADREIRDRIRLEARRLGVTGLRAEIEPSPLESDNWREAKALGQQYRADLVVWGDDTGARVTVNCLIPNEPDVADEVGISISETERSQIADSRAYHQFVVDDLPKLLTFLALLLISNIYSDKEDYMLAAKIVSSLTKGISPPSRDTSFWLAGAYSTLGRLYARLNDLDRAVVNYTKVIEIDLANTNTENVRIVTYDTALDDYAKGDVPKPNYYPFAYYQRGHIRYHLGDLDSAVKDFTKAIELDPNYVDAYYKRAIICQDHGDLNGALQDYTKAIELDPNFIDAYCLRAGIRYDQGDLDGAAHDCTKAIELDPGKVIAYYVRACVRYTQRDLESAVQDYTKAIELYPNYVDAYYKRANICQDNGDLNGAVQDYTKAIELDPNFIDAYCLRASIRCDLGDLDGAAHDCTKAIELDPGKVVAYYVRACARYTQRDLDSAVRDFTKAIELYPNYVNAYYKRANICQDQGDLNGAVQDYTKAIELIPDFANAYYQRGRIRFRQRDFAGALDDFITMKKLEPDSDKVMITPSSSLLTDS